jgi:hypothetical protein
LPGNARSNTLTPHRPCRIGAIDITGIAVVVLLIVAIVVIAILFRRGSFKAGMEALGA